MRVVVEVTSGALNLMGGQDPIPSLTLAELARVRGDRIRTARKAKGWSEQALAEKVGVSKSRISRYEHGDAVPFDVARRLARALEIDVVGIADVPRVKDGDDCVFHLHIKRSGAFLAAISPVPDDRAGPPREAPTALCGRRQEAREEVKAAVLAEVGAALDRFFERRAREVAEYLQTGPLGDLIDDGQSLALQQRDCLPPPVSVIDVNPQEEVWTRVERPTFSLVDEVER